jgi:hypothetical protein
MVPLKTIRVIIGVLGFCIAGCNDPAELHKSIVVDEAVTISPDFDDATIPPNIAPLNFTINKNGTRFAVEFRAPDRAVVRAASSHPTIKLPQNAWKALLRGHAGQLLTVNVSVKDKGQWRTFRPRTVSIARDSIDPYLTFRQLKPAYNWWSKMVIYQRDLGTFRSTEIISGQDAGCVNCHSFLNNRPETFLISIRNPSRGNATIFSESGAIDKIDAAFGYLSWHPQGSFVTYTDMKPRQFFHTGREEIRDVIDVREHLMNYDLKHHLATPLPSFTGPHALETYPAWSPDGNTLFFCACPVPWDTLTEKVPPEFGQLKYSLCKVSFDPARDLWGQAQTVVSSQQTGRSATMPRVSPDGKFVLFCMSDYGCFPAFQKSSDLYILETGSGAYHKLSINSDESESWHCWSSNSRWIAFSSKRHDGVFTRIYFSYIDSCGNAHTPFVLPQEDPELFDSFLEATSVPELTTGPIAALKGLLTVAGHTNGIAPANGHGAPDTTTWR